jgi:acyl carrier protein
MTQEDARKIVFSTLRRIAPEASPDELNPGVNFRDQLDIDSMDFLNFVIGLHKASGVDIPETDYPQLFTINGCVEYLVAHTS